MFATAVQIALGEPFPKNLAIAKPETLQNTALSQIMVPREHMVTVSEETTATAVEALSRGSGRSRFPVTNQQDHFTGLVNIRDVVRATAAGTDAPARQLMTTPLRLPAEQPVATAVTTKRQARAQLALVTNTTGQVVGIAAMEDLLEEIIGEFDDETDPARS